MNYTEEQVKEIIETNVKLMEAKIGLHAHINRLEDELSKEKLLREAAQKKYESLCESCIRFYVTERDITMDTLFAQVHVPRFMSSDDFTVGLFKQVESIFKAEREKVIFHDMNTSRCKTIEE